MNCKDCMYYQENTERYERKQYGKCCNEKFIYDSWLNDNEEDEVRKNNDCLLYADYEGYSASFEVGENFGCVHFKRRENQ